MSLREGTRRLALLLGVVGAVLCGLLSYAQLQSDMRQRAQHQRFEQLASSPVVQHERRLMKYLAPGITPPLAPGDLPNPSTFTNGEVRKINWTWDFEIASLELEDRETLYAMPAPGPWSYVLIAILPVLGFFVPWIAVRSVGWVFVGFVQPSKHES